MTAGMGCFAMQLLRQVRADSDVCVTPGVEGGGRELRFCHAWFDPQMQSSCRPRFAFGHSLDPTPHLLVVCIDSRFKETNK